MRDARPTPVVRLSPVGGRRRGTHRRGRVLLGHPDAFRIRTMDRPFHAGDPRMSDRARRAVRCRPRLST